MGEISEALKRSGASPPSGTEEHERVHPAGSSARPDTSSPNADRARSPAPHRDALDQADRDGPDPSGASDPRDLQPTAHVERRDEPAQRLSLQNPAVVSDNPAARLSLERPSSPESEAYRRIAFRLRDLASRRGARSIVVLSAEPSEGKTTTACNLAAQLARLDHSARTLLVDLDFHRASLAAALGVRVQNGSAEVIRGEIPITAAIHETDVHSLSILGLPAPATNVEALLASPALARMIRDLEQRYDHVIIDSPPVLAASDAQIILRSAAAALFVARASQTRARSLRRAIEEIPGEKILGTLLNGGRPAGADTYGYGLSYGQFAAAAPHPREPGTAETSGDPASDDEARR
jgi:non-specific protein-tyrosine kinase